eukprot:228322-Rhodomonas_salina.3
MRARCSELRSAHLSALAHAVRYPVLGAVIILATWQSVAFITLYAVLVTFLLPVSCHLLTQPRCGLRRSQYASGVAHRVCSELAAPSLLLRVRWTLPAYVPLEQTRS